MKSSGEYPNRMRIFKLDISEGGKVTGMFSENRKATDFDRKSGRKVYKNETTGSETVSMSYTFEIASTDKNNSVSKKLNVGDTIIVPVDKWSLNGSEEYTDKNGAKKYTTPRVVVWEWYYADKSQSSSKPASKSAKQEEEDDDQIPF
jgi:hypothetical protein